MRRLLPLLALMATPILAQEQVYRLSEADKQAAINAAAQKPETTTRLPIVDGRAPDTQDNRPHGEVGMMIGTGGTRAIWGTTAVPLGQNGTAQFSFSTGRYPGFNQYGYSPDTSGGSPYASGGWGLRSQTPFLGMPR